MAKNKKRRNTAAAAAGSSMDVTMENCNGCTPQDASERTATKTSSFMNANRKIKKSVPMRRAKSLRKMKAIERATANGEKLQVKVSKNADKALRIKSAKTLYD